MKKQISYFTEAVVNSYAFLFFSQSKVLGILLLAVSFFDRSAGLAGLVSVLFSITVVALMGYEKNTIKTGLYSFNSLLLGIGFGTFFNFNSTFWIWLLAGCLFSVMLTVIISSMLSKHGLPVLSIPFVISFWIVLLALNGEATIGLSQKDSYILNEMQSAGSDHLSSIQDYLLSIKVPYYVDLFFRSLSAILFQNNIITGMLITIGILIHSRIAFSLMILGFTTACIFNSYLGIYPEGISYYHLGTNIMMVSSAIGGFFLIPSARSYLWVVISIPVTVLLIGAFTKLLGSSNLPVFSLPFCVITIGLLYFFTLRLNPGKLQLTPLQHYSPEANLYQYLNGIDRLRDLKYLRFNLPFLGNWTVSQGYNGSITHKGDWDKAIDFVIEDEDRNTFQYPGNLPEHFYCFNKPVLACASGVVEDVVNYIDDNEIGKVNTTQNWGNSVVIKHINGLYSKVSHLKKGSVKVKPGDFVREGDIVGSCGNSGRSPEPHLHFQAQTTPYIGSKTFEHPFAYYIGQNKKDGRTFHSSNVPEEGMVVHPVEIDSALKQAFNLQPGYSVTVSSDNFADENWEVHTDALNQSYIYCKNTGATAYFNNNGTVFYFTSYYGSQSSLLYYFYLAAYKVILTSDPGIIAHDVFPLKLQYQRTSLWFHDFFAPFFQFIKRKYQSQCTYINSEFVITSSEYKEVFSSQKQVMQATVHIKGNSVSAFTVNLNGKIIKALWHTENSY